MFYVNGFAKITKENVTTQCPGCKKFHHVDLEDIMLTAGSSFSLQDMQVYCAACTAKRFGEDDEQ